MENGVAKVLPLINNPAVATFGAAGPEKIVGRMSTGNFLRRLQNQATLKIELTRVKNASGFASGSVFVSWMLGSDPEFSAGNHEQNNGPGDSL